MSPIASRKTYSLACNAPTLPRVPILTHFRSTDISILTIALCFLISRPLWAFLLILGMILSAAMAGDGPPETFLALSKPRDWYEAVCWEEEGRSSTHEVEPVETCGRMNCSSAVYNTPPTPPDTPVVRPTTAIRGLVVFEPIAAAFCSLEAGFQNPAEYEEALWREIERLKARKEWGGLVEQVRVADGERREALFGVARLMGGEEEEEEDLVGSMRPVGRIEKMEEGGLKRRKKPRVFVEV